MPASKRGKSSSGIPKFSGGECGERAAGLKTRGDIESKARITLPHPVPAVDNLRGFEEDGGGGGLAQRWSRGCEGVGNGAADVETCKLDASAKINKPKRWETS